jgi:hypothetical protein
VHSVRMRRCLPGGPVRLCSYSEGKDTSPEAVAIRQQLRPHWADGVLGSSGIALGTCLCIYEGIAVMNWSILPRASVVPNPSDDTEQ